MGTAVIEQHAIKLSEVKAAVGSRAFQRGRAYARGDRVLAVDWDPESDALTGVVVGNGAVYDTVVYFAIGEDGTLVFGDGDCSCPVGYNCKHVAAVAIAVADVGLAPPGAGGQQSRASAPQAPSWEQPLRALIEAPALSATGNPLAFELSVRASGLAAPDTLRLQARLMRPGARGGWVNGALAWSSLDSWHVQRGEHRAEHLQLARDLYAVQRSAEQRPSYYYNYGAEKALDLTDCGAQLWPLLDEAARCGLALIHSGKGLGELPPYAHGEVVIDVTREDDEGSIVRALLRIESSEQQGQAESSEQQGQAESSEQQGQAESDLEPLLFLGPSGHGVLGTDRDPGGDLESWPLRLVRLARPVPPQLQRMVLERETLAVPADELQRFAEEICPALRGVATVVSSDGSFTPPEVSEPALVLRTSYGEGHAVELGWEWAYEVGTAKRRAPLGLNGTGPGFRDLAAERGILAATDLAGTGLERYGLIDDAGRPADVPPVSLSGLASMTLTTEDLPRLAEQHGVAVETDGEPADYRDVSDSIQIGISTAEIAGERDWFDLGVSIAVDGRELPFAEVFTALASGESQMLLEGGAHFSLQEPRLQSLRQLIGEARALADSPPGELRISRYQAGFWSELAALGIVTEQAQEWERQVGALIELEALPEHEPPAALASQLRPYQREGFGWLASVWELELGGILADDMGLGKTLQTLALICHARDRDAELGPFLVVVPTSVVSNWANEAARFAPELQVEAVTETLAKSGRAMEELAGADVVVTTYTLLRLEAEAYRSLEWAGVILDEAQYVKNHQSKTYRSVRELPALFKLALTGTPLENSLMELWSILSITAPGLFPDPKRFAEHYARPIERHGDAERLARLRRRIKPLVKRRSKELVASDLPAKQEQTLEVELQPRHRKLYDTHLQRERQKVLGLLDDFDKNRFTILRSITLLRQLSLHPGLVDEGHDKVPCAKLNAFVEQLGDVIGGGHRALVFSQFTGFLARIRERLDKEGIGYCYLDGRTRKRDRVLERFKDGEDPVFLISLKAGGFGLNLTEADYCFLMDPWWNPATEAQAIDRTHRIGQSNPVMVYRLVAHDTIEEKVVALARRKAKLFSGVMDEGDLFASGVTAEDIRGLLS